MAVKRKRNLFLAGAALLAFFVAYPFLVDSEASYLVYFLYTAFLYVTVAQGWNLVAGYAGQASFGQHAFFGMGCYVTAISWKLGWAGYLDPLALVGSGVAAAALAAAVGFPLLAKLRGDYFALGTLGLGEILRVLAINGGDVTGGVVGISISSSAYSSMRHYYFIALAIMLFAMLALRLLLGSRIGLALVAVREDEMAAAASGINTLKYKIIAFSTGAFFTGLCGSLSAYYMFHIHPAGALSLNWVLVPILMTILGGTGTFWGPVLGAFTLTAVFELANAWMPETNAVFSSVFIVLITLFLPEGMVVWFTGTRRDILRRLPPFEWLALRNEK